MIVMKYTALVTIAAVVYTFILSGFVSAARAKTGVNAPAMAGQPDFDRVFRIHMNTVEQLVLFIPVLWLATSVVGDLWAAEIGVVWIVGRLTYAAGYRKAVEKRGPGFLITLLSTAILTAIALWGVIQAFMA
ncbi:MAG: MAPEG family protein [Gammaproteobacteria bacterium]|nr:MAG: MAPEG family protein [Gammaproteobacteria bacterium]